MQITYVIRDFRRRKYKLDSSSSLDLSVSISAKIDSLQKYIIVLPQITN